MLEAPATSMIAQIYFFLLVRVILCHAASLLLASSRSLNLSSLACQGDMIFIFRKYKKHLLAYSDYVLWEFFLFWVLFHDMMSEGYLASLKIKKQIPNHTIFLVHERGALQIAITFALALPCCSAIYQIYHQYDFDFFEVSPHSCTPYYYST